MADGQPGEEKMFKNKVVIITGASSGLGKTIAQAFIDENAKVAVCSRRFNLLKKIYGKNKKVLLQKVDVSIEAAIKLFVKKVNKVFGRIDILINNAGIAIPSSLDKIKYFDIKKTFQTNLFAPTIFVKEVLKLMKKNNYGRIVNISSGGSINCSENYFSYSASKAALNVLTKTLSKEIKSYDIKINSVSPGPCKTKMFPSNKLSTTLSIPTIKYLSSLKKDGPTGKFFWFMNKIEIFPDLRHIDWGNPKSYKTR